MKKTYRDPVTGDILNTGEYISWIIQGIIRRWAFLIIITVVTIVCWITFNATVLLWWNLGASYLALVIESIVGISMYNQTRRDAVVVREIRTISQHVERLTEVVLKDVVAIEEQLEEHNEN